MKDLCRRTNSRGRSVLPAISMVRLLESTMGGHLRREYYTCISLDTLKSLGRGKTLVVGPIDKEILGKDAAIN